MVTLDLHDYELTVLIEYHMDQHFKCSELEDYASAANHKKRYEELLKSKELIPY